MPLAEKGIHTHEMDCDKLAENHLQRFGVIPSHSLQYKASWLIHLAYVAVPPLSDHMQQLSSIHDWLHRYIFMSCIS